MLLYRRGQLAWGQHNEGRREDIKGECDELGLWASWHVHFVLIWKIYRCTMYMYFIMYILEEIIVLWFMWNTTNVNQTWTLVANTFSLKYKIMIRLTNFTRSLIILHWCIHFSCSVISNSLKPRSHRFFPFLPKGWRFPRGKGRLQARGRDHEFFRPWEYPQTYRNSLNRWVRCSTLVWVKLVSIMALYCSYSRYWSSPVIHSSQFSLAVSAPLCWWDNQNHNS